jgi:mRNA interferase MazF
MRRLLQTYKNELGKTQIINPTSRPMTHRKFDVVVVDFPFIDKPEISKVRPAIIISSKKYTEETGFAVIAMITLAKRSKLLSDIKISNHEKLHLHPSSIIRMKFFNIPKEKILRTLGKLDANDRKILRSNLRKVF